MHFSLPADCISFSAVDHDRAVYAAKEAGTRVLDQNVATDSDFGQKVMLNPVFGSYSYGFLNSIRFVTQIAALTLELSVLGSGSGFWEERLCSPQSSRAT